MLAILVVVYGHWMVAVVLHPNSELIATQLLVIEPWTRWATWLGQVMPLFFLVGGLVNAGSLLRAQRHGLGTFQWVRKRARRLLRPFVPLLAIWIPLSPVLALLGVPVELVALAGDIAFLPLWFLVVYLLVIVLAPATWWLHRHSGLGLLAGAVVLVALVDGLDALGAPGVRTVNYLLVFAIAHQLGYLWHENRLPEGARALYFTWVGFAGTAVLVFLAGYPLSMVGLQVDIDSNATPPILALVTLTVAQLGLVLALHRPVERWLYRPLPWAFVVTVGAAILTVFLWHMSALVAVAALTHLPNWWPQFSDITPQWWALRPIWLLLCTLALILLVLAFRRFEGAGDPGKRGPALTITGILATAIGLGLVLNQGLYDPERWLGVPLGAVALLAFGLICLGVHRAGRTRASGGADA